MLISIIVSNDYLVDESKQRWIEEYLTAIFAEGTQIGGALKIVSLSMIFATELSGGYKDTDRIKLLSGQPNYEENLCDYKFKVSPFAFFQVNSSVFTSML